MIELVRVENISKSYNTGKPKTLEVIKDISFTIYEGDIISIIGPSGCGKSTLVKIISSISKQNTGKIITTNTLSVGYVSQHPALLPWRTVEDNLKLPYQVGNLKNIETNQKNILKLVGLDGFENYKPNQLSGGMKQRLSIARALILRPSLLCLDEPFSSLDEILKFELYELILALHQKEKLTTILVTHDIKEATFLSNKIIVLSNRPSSINGIYNNPELYPRTKKYLYSKNLADSAAKIRELMEE